VANLAELPGISSVLRKVISEQLAAVIVLPNKFSFRLVEDIPMKVFKCPEPEGVLRIALVQARDLMRMDFSLFGRKGKSDPYAVISVGAKEYRTKIIRNSVNPVWEEEWEVVIDVARGQVVHINLWDWDQGMADEFMGRVSIPIHALVNRAQTDLWINLEEATSGRIRIRTEWLVMSTDVRHFEERKLEVHGKQLSSAVLLAYIDSCKQLPLTKSGMTKPDPVVQLSVSGRDPQETLACLYTRNPVYEQGFVLLVQNPDVDELHLKVYDLKSKYDLGFLRIALADLLRRNGMEYFKQPFKLKKSGIESNITLHLQMLFTDKVDKPARPIKPVNTGGSVSQAQLQDDSEDIPNEVGSDNESQDRTETAANDCNKEISDKLQNDTNQLDQSDQSDRMKRDNQLENEPKVDKEKREKMDEEVDTDSVGGLSRYADDSEYEDVANPVEPGCGTLGECLLISLHFKSQKEVLSLTVHQARHVPSVIDGKTSLVGPSFQVRLNLLPNSSSKGKTAWKQRSDEGHLVWDESMYFAFPHSELKNKELEVSLLERRGLFTKSNVIYRSIYCLASEDCEVSVCSKWIQLERLPTHS